ncbi:hypothetical protein 4PHCISA25_0072 [Staphylococcus phage 4PHCISA25]|nr:hypothetical protein 4PHCISA25_0072 [Staphylococcus phage 4PHCISA25]
MSTSFNTIKYYDTQLAQKDVDRT